MLSRAMITINNPDFTDVTMLKNMDYSFIVGGYEHAPTTGTRHIQAYVEFNSKKRFNTIKRACPKARIDKAKGHPADCAGYCQKGNVSDKPDEGWRKYDDAPHDTFQVAIERDGELMDFMPGKRNDLNDVKDAILSGDTTVKKIMLNDPMMYHQYGRTLEKIQDLVDSRWKRTEPCKIEWRYGPTKTGKTEAALGENNKDYDPDIHFIWPRDGDWCDMYDGHDEIIINDFRGNIMDYDKLIQLADVYNSFMRRRGRAPMPMKAKVIHINSPLSPQECFPNRHEKDKLDQLLRRCSVYKHEKGKDPVLIPYEEKEEPQAISFLVVRG